jgi:hypothetical protein
VIVFEVKIVVVNEDTTLLELLFYVLVEVYKAVGLVHHLDELKFSPLLFLLK